MASINFDGNQGHKFGDTATVGDADDVGEFIKEFSVDLQFATANSPRLGKVLSPASIGSATGSGQITYYASDGASDFMALLDAWTWEAVETDTTKPPTKYYFVEEPDGTAGSIRHTYGIVPSNNQGPVNRAGQGGDQERSFGFALVSYAKETIV